MALVVRAVSAVGDFFGRSFLEGLFISSQKNRMAVIIVWPRKFVDSDTRA